MNNKYLIVMNLFDYIINNNNNNNKKTKFYKKSQKVGTHVINFSWKNPGLFEEQSGKIISLHELQWSFFRLFY